MFTRKINLRVFLYVIVFCLAHFLLFGQGLEIVDSRKISNRALELAKENKWDEAYSILQEGLRQCGADDKGRKSRGLLNFSLGYLYQIQADAEPEESLDFLEKSAEYYKKTLGDLPGNHQVISNLVLVLKRTGQWQQAVSELERAVDEDKERRGLYYLEIGDIYNENKKMADALDAYQKAAKQNLENDTPHWRILSIYREYREPAEIIKILNYCEDLLGNGRTELARSGFELVMAKANSKTKKWAESALIQWAELGASQNWISEESLSILPDQNKWPGNALKELWAMMDVNTLTDISWWERNLLRRHVAALVLTNVASSYVVNGEYEKAASVYEYALKLSPGIHEYRSRELRNRPVLPVKIDVELAKLYSRHESIDPDGDKFKNLEGRLKDLETHLFRQKSEYYKLRDLESIQLSHTILGLIYAEQDIWESSWAPANGIFQLEHALSTAEKRAMRDSANFQPLPHLEKLLADGYKKVGQKTTAAACYLRAAKSYLDTDGLKEAEEALENAKALQYNDSPIIEERMSGLETILKGHYFVSNITVGDIKDSSLSQLHRREPLMWLFSSDEMGLGTAFLNRQRFKVLSDFGSVASQVGDYLKALWLHTEALSKIYAEENLACNGDAFRLDMIKDTILQSVEFDESKSYYETGYALYKKDDYEGGKIWWVPTLSVHVTPQVGVSKDFLLASKIGNHMAKKSDFQPDELKFYVNDGKVIIFPLSENPELISMTKTTLETLPGIRRVDVRKRSEEIIIR